MERIAKRYVNHAKSILAKEGHAADDDSVNQLALLLRDAKVLDKPKTKLGGYIVVTYTEDEFGETNANLSFEFRDDRGHVKIPSAEFAVWLLEMASDTAAMTLPSGDNEEDE